MKVINGEERIELAKERLADSKNTLEKIYYSHDNRVIFKWHHYLEIYNNHFEPLIKKSTPTFAPNGKIRFLEIGVQNGGSLQMWNRFFDGNAIIYGIDIDERCKEFETKECQVRIGSQDDPAFLKKVIDEMGGVDIVLDDGSHVASHQLASFKALFDEVSEDGLYIVEDLHTSYWDDWEGGLRREGTFIEVSKKIIDHIHEWYTVVDSDLSSMDLKTKIKGIHMYDSMVVLQKGKKEEPVAVEVGSRTI